jgi:serine/threonine protein kinase
MSEKNGYVSSSDIKKQSLKKYSTKEEVTKKWISLYKKLNTDKSSGEYNAIIIEAISVSEFVIENTLKDDFLQGRFIDNLNKLIEMNYPISTMEFNKLKRIKWYRNMAAHNTETVMQDIVNYESAKDTFITMGKLLYTLNVLLEEDITPSCNKLKANVGELIGGNCLLQELIGQGGSGRVFKAYHKRLDLIVAVKEISHELMSTIDVANEKNMLLTLRHNGIPRIYDIIEDNQTYYLIMDYIEGQTLKEYIEKMERLPVNAVTRLAIELCNIISYLHNLKGGIIFRDLKPGNIMLDRENHIHLIDFGISKIFDAKESSQVLYSGTCNYSSPEQLKGEICDNRTDIYSLGAVIYYMVEGHNPAENGEQSFRRSTPESLTNIIEKAMAHDKEGRYNRIEELGDELNSVYSTQNGVALPHVIKKSKRKFSRPLLAAIVIFLLSGSVIMFKLSNRDSGKETKNQILTLSNSDTETPTSVETQGKLVSVNPTTEKQTENSESQDGSIPVVASTTAFKGKAVLTVNNYSIDGTNLIVKGVIENNYSKEFTISSYDIYVMDDSGNKFPLDIYEVLGSGTNTSNIIPGEKRQFELVFNNYIPSNSLTMGVTRIYCDLTTANFTLKFK